MLTHWDKNLIRLWTDGSEGAKKILLQFFRQKKLATLLPEVFTVNLMAFFSQCSR